MPFSILSKRRWPFSRQILKDSQQMKMPHTKVMCFFKKDIGEKHLTAVMKTMVGDGVKTVFLWQTGCRSVMYSFALNARQMLTKNLWWCLSLFFFLQDRTVCLCLYVCADMQSWCNLVWQVTVTLYYSKNPQECLTNKFWKGYMGISGRVTSLALVSLSCDPAICLLKWLKWVHSLGSILLSFSQKLLFFKVMTVHPAWRGGRRALMRSHHVDLLNWRDCEWQGCIFLAQTESEGLHTKLSFRSKGPQRAGTVMFDLDLLNPGSVRLWHTAYIERDSLYMGKYIIPLYQ